MTYEKKKELLTELFFVILLQVLLIKSGDFIKRNFLKIIV